MTALVVPVLAAAALAFLFFARLAGADLILARGDTFAYFYPYWSIRDAALAAGQLPLWTPDVFMGAPLLANSQLGTFYPPNWLTVGLAAPDAVRVSILLHVAWAFLGAYTLARRALHAGMIAALAAGAAFALGGYLGAHVEQVNQLQGLAWMPWLFLLFDRALDRPLRVTPFLGMGLALQVFTGHTQTVFITAVGLGLYGLLSRRWRFVPVLLGAGALAALLALPQLVPTLELAGVSNRRGGFNANQATAFSLSPLVLGRALLPNYDTPIFGEYIGYTGVIGLGLAVVGLLLGRPNTREAPRRARPVATLEGFTAVTETDAVEGPPGWRDRLLAPSPRLVWPGLALVGLVLALGLYTPVYWALAGLPGFNLFRVPARWLALVALALAMLAALGVDALRGASPRGRLVALVAVVAVVAALAALSPLAARAPDPVPLSAPEPLTVAGWGLALVALVALVALPAARLAPALLLLALVAELLLASQVMPFNELTAPEAYAAPRLTVDQLRAFQADEGVPGRALGISGLLFDPGDRAALEARYGAMGLSPDATRLALVATKMKDILAPNLGLLWGIPSVDGFDGGLLPTAFYTAFTSLLLPDGEPRTLDGRIGELLARPPCAGACLPEPRWLHLTNTRYLITDKVHDVWHEDVAYDTQFAHTLAPVSPLTLSGLPDFEATALHVLYTCLDARCPAPEASVALAGNPEPRRLEYAGEAVEVGTYRLVRLTGPEAMRPAILKLEARLPVTVRALTLVDTRTGDFVTLALAPWERVLSSDVKVYRNEAVLPRAFLVHRWRAVPDTERGTEQALDLMRDPAFDPGRAVVLATADAQASDGWQSAAASGRPSVSVRDYRAERVEIAVEAPGAGYLVLTDAYYPGWEARVNGEPAEILRADVMFRAVRVPAGPSEVVVTYRPAWFPGALVLGAAAWPVLLLVAAALWSVRRR